MTETDSLMPVIMEVESLKEQHKFDEALEILESNVAKHSDDYRIFEEIWDIYIYMAQLDKAVKAIDFALELNPDSATGNYLKWFLLLSSEKIAECITYLDKSNRLFGNNAEVLRNLWFAYTLNGEAEKGISILKRALHLNPWDELITEDLAMALISHWDVLEWNVLLRKIALEKGN